jgi:hypothetical protein
MEKFVIRNEDEFQRLRKFLNYFDSLEVEEETCMGRRRYPASVYMNDEKVSAFVYGNDGLYRIDARTDRRGEAYVGETLGNCMSRLKQLADSGDISSVSA